MVKEGDIFFFKKFGETVFAVPISSFKKDM